MRVLQCMRQQLKRYMQQLRRQLLRNLQKKKEGFNPMLDKPTPETKEKEQCPYSGGQSYKGSHLKECLIANRISCAHANTPDLFNNCFLARNHRIYLETVRKLLAGEYVSEFKE